MMQKTEEKKKQKESNCYSNANYYSVFLRPKIKYYMCPKCQTLLKIEKAPGKTRTREHKPKEKGVKRKEAKQLEAQLEEELKAERLKAERKEAEELKQFESQKLELKETVQIRSLATSEEKINQQSDNECKYYFSYLGERKKGEEIPSSCLECPKSLDCMLYNFKSKESIAEIKKWYPTKLNF